MCFVGLFFRYKYGIGCCFFWYYGFIYLKDNFGVFVFEKIYGGWVLVCDCCWMDWIV